MKEKILVSACLLSNGFKYDGTNNINASIIALQDKYEFIPICPEVFGGLNTPRKPSEQVLDKVLMIDGTDVTEAFINGAKKSLQIALNNGCNKAILKAKSPSCGKGIIYDGTFTHTKKEGNGVTADLFIKNGITIYTEEEIDLL